MIFTKTGAGGTDTVWFSWYEIDGYSLDDKRTPIEENDIPDIVALISIIQREEFNRKRTEQSFFCR